MIFKLLEPEANSKRTALGWLTWATLIYLISTKHLMPLRKYLNLNADIGISRLKIMQEAHLSINKLVSLTYDENPSVRKKAAESLAALNDPAALFALVELSYDKDPSVREKAAELLEKTKKNEPEVMSFAKIFSAGAKKEENVSLEAREKVLLPITQIFEKRLGKEKAALVKKRMMPTIEKIYLKQKTKMKGEDGGKKAMQEFLTSYLDVISDLDQVGGAQAEAFEVVQPAEKSETTELDIDPVGMNAQVEMISSEIAGIEAQNIEEIKEREEIQNLPDTFFKKAYEIMMLSGGDEKVMKREMKHMKKSADQEITLAFHLARKQFKEKKITNITKIKDKMRNVNTDPLIVQSVENMDYQRTKTKKAIVTRVVVNDEDGNEGVIYLFEDRGVSLQPGMRVKILRGLAKTFKFSGETALTLGTKSNVYIVL
jgi:hypothetical protein